MLYRMQLSLPLFVTINIAVLKAIAKLYGQLSLILGKHSTQLIIYYCLHSMGVHGIELAWFTNYFTDCFASLRALFIMGCEK